MISRQSTVVGTTEAELSDVLLFRERAEKLAASQSKYQNIPILSIRRDDDSQKLEIAANTPDLDAILNLAVQFRFFFADKEPTRFEKIVTKIRHRASDEWAQNYIDRIAEHYRLAMRQTDTSSRLGHPIANRKMISLWFNSEFFHSEADKRAELRTIQDAIGEGPSLFQFYTAIVKCSSFIQMLYGVVHKLEAGHEYIYTPNYHFDAAK
jgi:hypothetical protein